MYLLSSNASSFLNNFYFDCSFKQSFANEIKERTFNFVYSFINDLNNSISGLEYINIINKYFIFEGTKIIKIKDAFFKEQKEIYLNSLNPIWYKKIIKSKQINGKDKQLMFLYIYNKISELNLHYFFEYIFLKDNKLSISIFNQKNKEMEIKEINNPFKLNPLFFSKKTKKIKPYYFNLLKFRNFEKNEFNFIREEMVKFLDYILIYSIMFVYNRGRLKLEEEIEDELIEKGIISKDFLFDEKGIFVDNLTRFKLFLKPREFVTYDFENYTLKNVKSEFLKVIEIIDFIKEIKVDEA